eukprot:s103_g20.t1
MGVIGTVSLDHKIHNSFSQRRHRWNRIVVAAQQTEPRCAMDLAFTAPATGRAPAAQLHRVSKLQRPSPEHSTSRSWQVVAASCSALGLLQLRNGGRSRGCRVSRAGAPPKPIWQTKRQLAVEQLERQWRLTEVQVEPQESKEDFNQALLRFLGGSVLMAVLAQGAGDGRPLSWVGRRDLKSHLSRPEATGPPKRLLRAGQTSRVCPGELRAFQMFSARPSVSSGAFLSSCWEGSKP